MPKKNVSKRLDVAINLVPQDPFFETVMGRFLKWALSVGRYIVIFTELIVIVSFASRFTLDRMVTDLNGAITQKERAISSYGDLEKNFRFIQQQIEDYKQLSQDSNLVEIFPLLNKSIPSNVIFETLLVRADSVNFTGAALSQESLNVLINNLQLSPYFTEVSINKIESIAEKSASVNFDIRAKINLKGDGKN